MKNVFAGITLTILISLVSIQNSQAQSSGAVPLLCASYGSGYAKQFAQAASKALLDSGVKNFRVKASLKPDGQRPTARIPENLIPDGLVKVSEKSKDCKTTKQNTVVCKSGYEAKFDATLPSAILTCEVPKILTLTVKAGKVSFVTTQKVKLPGAFVPRVVIENSSNHEIAK